MKKSEAKRAARDIVWHMLMGRCQPEREDVEDISQDPEDMEMMMAEICAVLDRLAKRVEK